MQKAGLNPMPFILPKKKWWGRIAFALGQSCTIGQLKSQSERYWDKAG
jgi:hypothetical protein